MRRLRTVFLQTVTCEGRDLSERFSVNLPVMKDISIFFCIVFSLALGLVTLDGTLDRISKKASAEIFHGMKGCLSTYETALAKAQSSEKPIVLILDDSTSHESLRMKEDVYSSQLVADFRDQFVWAYLDVTHPWNQKIATRLNAAAMPAYFILAEDGTVLSASTGIMSAQMFAGLLQSVVVQRTVAATLRQQKEESPSKGPDL